MNSKIEKHDVLLNVRSPITGSDNVVEIERVSCQQLIEMWQRQLDIDIAPQFDDVDTIFLFKCLDSGLQFFSPPSIAGNGQLYEDLEQFDWYYMPHKWEHECALNDIRRQDKVLEVGCGRGGFVETLSAANISVQGIELNEAAVENARQRGLQVEHATVEQMATRHPQEFDVVCHFEVLEHVVDITGFLQACVDCLKPGGRLLFAVPNMAGFVGWSETNLLNQPPHHMSQWYPKTIKYVEKTLPIKLNRMRFEPLALHHVDWYVEEKWRRLNENVRGAWRVRSQGIRTLKFLLRNRSARRLVTGHTQYACFTKHS